MANITNYLNKIKTAVYGKDVRGAIHDAIKQVYDDASVNHDNANMEVKMARGTHNTLNDRLDKTEQKLDETNAQFSRKANKNEVFSMANMGQDIREAMTGGSVAIVGEDSVLANNILDSQVLPCKTSFLRSKFRMTQECVRLGDNSRQDYDKAVDTTWFIPLTGQDTIKVNGCRYLYFYDENKDYVDRLVNVSNEEPFIKDLSQHPILSSACYVRVGIHSSLPNPTIMINGVYYDDYETELNNEVEESQIFLTSRQME